MFNKMKYKYEDIHLGAPLIKLPKFYILLAALKLNPKNIGKCGYWQVTYSVDNNGELLERIYGCFYNHHIHKHLISFLQPKVTEINTYDHIKPIEFAISQTIVPRGFGYRVTENDITRIQNKKIKMWYEFYLLDLWETAKNKGQ